MNPSLVPTNLGSFWKTIFFPNIQTLVIETLKFLNRLHPQMTEVFWDKLFVPYTLKDKNELPLETLEMRSMRLDEFCLNCPDEGLETL